MEACIHTQLSSGLVSFSVPVNLKEATNSQLRIYPTVTFSQRNVLHGLMGDWLFYCGLYKCFYLIQNFTPWFQSIDYVCGQIVRYKGRTLDNLLIYFPSASYDLPLSDGLVTPLLHNRLLWLSQTKGEGGWFNIHLHAQLASWPPYSLLNAPMNTFAVLGQIGK